MPQAARLNDPTSHGKPLNPGPGSGNVNIGYARAWRALPRGVGGGIESATIAAASLMGKPQLRPPEVVNKLADIQSGLTQAAQAAGLHGSAAAAATTATAMSGMMAANASLASAYTAASSSGPEPAAATAFAQGLQAAVAAAAAAAVSSIAAMADMHVCPTVSGPAPHGPGVVTRGSGSVNINYLPAARAGDKLFEATGAADPIARGCVSVNIGDSGGGAGGGGSSAGAGASGGGISGGGGRAKRRRGGAAPPAQPGANGTPSRNQPETTETVLPDGTRIITAADGTRSVHHPDGTMEMDTPDGIHSSGDQDGNIRTRHPNGTEIVQSPDGTTTTIHPDGTREVHPPPDGASTASTHSG